MENFRNKQWFKDLSDERKTEICKKFDISQETLKKCGRLNKDGKLVIDLLRIDHLLTRPEHWRVCYEILNDNKFDHSKYSSNIDMCINLYLLFHGTSQLLKYKDTLHNRILVDERTKYIILWLDRFYNSDDLESKEYFAYQVYSHVSILIKSDLNLLK